MTIPDQAVTFTVPGPPRPKQRPRLGRGGCVYTPATTTRYEHSVALAATSCRPSTWEKTGRMSVNLVCYFADNRRRDSDNVLKSVLDGMNGVLYEDDSQVTLTACWKMVDREHPRAEVTVTRLGEAW